MCDVGVCVAADDLTIVVVAGHMTFARGVGQEGGVWLCEAIVSHVPAVPCRTEGGGCSDGEEEDSEELEKRGRRGNNHFFSFVRSFTVLFSFSSLMLLFQPQQIRSEFNWAKASLKPQ